MSLPRPALAPLAAGSLLGLTACGLGATADTRAASRDQVAGSSTGGPARHVPEKCAARLAVAPADLADVEMLPEGWPDPPVDATLCATSRTADGAHESMAYATDAAPEEVLAAYAEALSPYGAQRDQDGLGREVVVGAVGEVHFQVRAEEETFTVVLAR